MKKTLPLIVIHRLFSAAVISVLAALGAFLIYLYVAFSAPLIGDVSAPTSPDPLSRLDDRKLQTALGRLKTRENLPNIPTDLPDPYDAARTAL